MGYSYEVNLSVSKLKYPLTSSKVPDALIEPLSIMIILSHSGANYI